MWHISNSYLAKRGQEQQDNAIEIWNATSAAGWTLQATAALLGNMWRESTINPGLFEGLTKRPYTTSGKGYGLTQWTPASKFIQRASDIGYTYPPYTEADTYANAGAVQIAVIIHELNPNAPNVQWYPGRGYNLTRDQFIHGNYTVEKLTCAFWAQYERPSSTAYPSARVTEAEYWYEFLGGVPPRRSLPAWLLMKLKEVNKRNV